MEPEDARQVFVQGGELEEWEELPEGWGLSYSKVPSTVKCDHCGKEFEVENEDDPCGRLGEDDE